VQKIQTLYNVANRESYLKWLVLGPVRLEGRCYE